MYLSIYLHYLPINYLSTYICLSIDLSLSLSVFLSGYLSTYLSVCLTSQHVWWRSVLHCACHATCIFPNPLQTSPRLPSFLTMLQNPNVWLTFGKVQNPLRLKWRVDDPKPNVVCGLTCCLQNSLFRHLNFQKWSEHVFEQLHFQKRSKKRVLPFWLRNVLRTTKACTFSTYFQKCSECGALRILSWKHASHHKGVQFFICHLTRWLVSRVFYLFAHRDLLLFCSSLLWRSFFFLSLLWLFPPLLLRLSICRKFDF